MTLDVELVCPACRRFWHGPPGRLPYPRTGVCTNEGHALKRRPPKVEVIPAVRELRVDWLTDDDIERARDHGLAVFQKARLVGAQHRRGDFASLAANLENERHAAIAELAVARFVELPWNASLEAGGADVGDDIDARWTRHRRGCLIVHVHDPPDWRYVLVRGYAPDDLWLSGWIYGREADGLNDPRAMFPDVDHWVEADDCRPIGTLRMTP